MKPYLKSYQVTLQALGPVFIGSGREIGKKEYIFLTQQEAAVPDMEKFYQALADRNKAAAFEDYLLGYSRDDLTAWLRKQKIRLAEIKPYMKYTLDCSDAVIERGVRLQLMECMKDAYGCPYIPGSSLKGMFRTILLGSDILKNPDKYRKAKSTLKRNAPVKKARNAYLGRDISDIEAAAFRTLERQGSKPKDAVNDCLQGFRVSDSEPLSLSSLMLSQRVELHTNGVEKKLPLLRECIRPGTKIQFTVTIDTSVCRITENMIFEAVRNFMDSYYRNFAAAFPQITKPKEDAVFLGGGSGFVSKTVIYPLFGKQDGIEVTQQVFDAVFGRLSRTHKHDRDRQFGASPHILKCTKYQGKTVQMGLCRIQDIKPVTG